MTRQARNGLCGGTLFLTTWLLLLEYADDEPMPEAGPPEVAMYFVLPILLIVIWAIYLGLTIFFLLRGKLSLSWLWAVAAGTLSIVYLVLCTMEFYSDSIR